MFNVEFDYIDWIRLAVAMRNDSIKFSLTEYLNLSAYMHDLVAFIHGVFDEIQEERKAKT